MGVAPVPATSPILMVDVPLATVVATGAAAAVGATVAAAGADVGADSGGALVDGAGAAVEQPSTNDMSATRTGIDRPPQVCITLECREWLALNRSPRKVRSRPSGSRCTTASLLSVDGWPGHPEQRCGGWKSTSLNSSHLPLS